MKYTLEQLRKDLDKYTSARPVNVFDLTKDQGEFIKICRSGEKIISVPKMVKLWDQLGWGKITEVTLRRVVKKFCDENGIKFY